MRENQQVCINSMQAVKEAFPELQKKVKVHLFLHLAQDMSDFGPTSTSAERYGYVEVFIKCTACIYLKLSCRCETYNSLIRTRNIFGNSLAPS